MKRAFLLMIMAIVFVGCDDPKPQANQQSTNPNYQVALLFEHDRCKVYRFMDHWEWRYFVKCKDADVVTSEWQEHVGKHYEPREIVTVMETKKP